MYNQKEGQLGNHWKDRQCAQLCNLPCNPKASLLADHFAVQQNNPVEVRLESLVELQPFSPFKGRALGHLNSHFEILLDSLRWFLASSQLNGLLHSLQNSPSSVLLRNLQCNQRKNRLNNHNVDQHNNRAKYPAINLAGAQVLNPLSSPASDQQSSHLIPQPENLLLDQRNSHS